MILRFGNFLVLANLLTLIVIQSQFGHIGCKSPSKQITEKNNYFEESVVDMPKEILQDTVTQEDKVISMNDLLKGVSSKNKEKADNNLTESEIDFTDNDYSIPTESSSNGRLTGMSRGRSRNRHFKFRFGEVASDSSVDTNDSSVNSEPEKQVKEEETEPSQVVRESVLDSDISLPSVFGREKTTSSIPTYRSNFSEQSDAETEPEEMKSPIPIVPIEEESRLKNSVDQVIQLLHNQSNLEALKELKRKKDLKKEKLENQEMVMDKLMSVIDSMQKRPPFKKDYVYGAVMNYNINDLNGQQYFYEENYMDTKKDKNEDSLKRLREFEERKLKNELKNASMTRKFYSKPSSVLASELNAYSSMFHSNPKKNIPGSGSESGSGFGSDPGKEKLFEPKGPILLNSPNGIAKNLETRPSEELPTDFPKKPETKSVGVGFSDSSNEHASHQGHISESLRKSPEGVSGESKLNIEEHQSPTEGEIVHIPTLTQPQNRANYSTSSPNNSENSSGEEEELSNLGEKPEKGPSGNPLKDLESELMKLQDLAELDLKRSTSSNNFGRIKPKTSYTHDEYLVRTSSPEDTLLTRGKVAVGRVRRKKESREIKTHSPENKSVSKPFVTVGRLKSPTRATSIDKMRPIKEDDDSDFDYNTATGVFNIRSAKAFMDNQNAKLQMEEQLRDPYNVPRFFPSDLSEMKTKETHFLGDKAPTRSQPNAFRKGMMASMSQNMAGSSLSASLGPPIVRVQRVGGHLRKNVIRKKM
ncbi:uncharacterized protein ELE39_000548 [Cryptosporidium sp. chipmunk genotype I]|uniref:uncharacterized protein n=1 Tax=Cryptosporidium sp. chipmunk genotype I TaxID=1280935 RepID=UPI00351A8888|nr:hypothetical protein ELE39_000548 [Cryptosporidium sp. chipmunk genotype I]